MSLEREEEAEVRERRQLVRQRRLLLAQQRELNRLEIRRRWLELTILALVVVSLILSLFADRVVGSAPTLGDRVALELGAFIQLRD